MYKFFYTNQGVLDAIASPSGASLPFNSQTKTFDESHPLTVELRAWEQKNGALDLSDRAPEPIPPTPVGQTVQTIDLVDGEKQWLWNGDYWLSQLSYTGRVSNDVTATMAIPLGLDLERNIFLKNLELTYIVAGTNQVNKYWKLHLFRISSIETWTCLASVETSLKFGNIFYREAINLNLAIDVANVKCLVIQAEKISTPGAFRFNAVLNYKQINSNV